MKTYTLVEVTKNAQDGEAVYHYRSAEGDVKFQADPKNAWCWLTYSKASTAPKRSWNKVINAYVEAMIATQETPKTLAI
jgi:hypothetical protein